MGIGRAAQEAEGVDNLSVASTTSGVRVLRKNLGSGPWCCQGRRWPPEPASFRARRYQDWEDRPLRIAGESPARGDRRGGFVLLQPSGGAQLSGS